MTCGIIVPRQSRIIGVGERKDGYLAECIREGQHIKHVFRTPEGQFFVWEADWDCDCYCCKSEDVDDHCFTYARISKKEYLELVKGQT